MSEEAKEEKEEEIPLPDETKVEETEIAKNSSKFLIWAIVFIVLLTALFLSIKFFYHPEPKVETYTSQSGFTFTNMAGLWNTEWKSGDTLYNLHFHYNPGQTENITLSGAFDDVTFNKGYVYLGFDPEGEDLGYVRLAMLELSLNLVKAINVNPTIVCLKNNTACKDVPVMTCSTTTEPLIYLVSKEPTVMALKDNCILLQGKGPELIRVSDKLLFHWFGII